VRLRENGIEAFIGNGVKGDILAAANVAPRLDGSLSRSPTPSRLVRSSSGRGR